MAVIQADDIVDLVRTTQKELGRMKWTEIATDTQDHIAFNQLMRSNRMGFRSGTSIEWRVMVRHSGAAKNVGLFQVDDVNVGETMELANVPWRHWNTNYAIEEREISMNRDPARIVEEIKVRRADAMISLAELVEADFWSKPTDSTDAEKPFGVPYWITWGSGTQGFNGGNPSGFTAGRGGIDSGTFGRWDNWTDTYVDVSKSDFIRKARKAATFTRFMAPTPIPTFNTGDRFGYFTTYNVVGRLEEAAESQNDSLGNDIASKDGRVLFRGNPVTWAPYLENKAGDPFYGINWGVFKVVFLTGWFMKEGRLTRLESKQHTTLNAHVDTTANIVCRDLRRCFVLATSDPEA